LKGSMKIFVFHSSLPSESHLSGLKHQTTSPVAFV
jgi:hypothetical protein